jgi:hypothetical protein
MNGYQCDSLAQHFTNLKNATLTKVFQARIKIFDVHSKLTNLKFAFFHSIRRGAQLRFISLLPRIATKEI